MKILTEAEVLKNIQNGNNRATCYFNNMTRTFNLQPRLSKVGRKIKYAGTAKTVKIASQTLTGSPLSTHSLRTSEFKKKPHNPKQQNKTTTTPQTNKKPPKNPKKLQNQTNNQNPNTSLITILLRTVSCV